MRFGFAALAAAAVVPTVLADIFPTSPVASTKWKAGKHETVRWQDSDTAPSINTTSAISIGLWTGSQQQQTQLANLTGDIDPKLGRVSVTVDPSLGSSGPYYFLRFHKAGTDPTQDVYTAKFTITGMRGNFSSAIQNQLGLASSAPAASSVQVMSASGGARAASVVVVSSTVGPTSRGAPALGTASASSSQQTTSASTTSGTAPLSILGSAFFATASSMLYFVL